MLISSHYHDFIALYRRQVLTVILCVLLAAAGYFACFYGGFCLLGGPDGAILSRDSFLFSIPSFLISFLLLYAATRFVPATYPVFAPLLLPVLAWLVAISFSHATGVMIMLAGTPIAILLSAIFWAVSRFRIPPPL